MKSQIKTKDFVKIKFNSYDNLPLNKLLRLYNLTIIARFVFKENDINYTVQKKSTLKIVYITFSSMT